MVEMTPAEAAVREEVVQEGRITFRRFMELALYEAPGAYYASGTGQIGPHGDYFTSPEIHPVFGALVARQIEQVWAEMDRPEVFSLIEMGAGSGALARDILSYVATRSPDFFEAIEYVVLERNSDFAKRQQQTLAEIGPVGERVAWRPSPPPEDLSSGILRGCVLSNELPDAFPVHRVVVRAGILKEIYVGLAGGQFVEVEDVPSTAALGGYFDRLGFLPPEGARVEVNLDALAWIRRVAASLRRGAVITLDYGYPAEDLYSEKRREGSLLCFYRHSVSSNPYARIGRQDMTTHVDFTSLALEGEAGGLRPLRLTTQRSFLSALGMDLYAEILGAMGLRRSDYEANRLAMRELMDPNGLGRIKVLIQQKGLHGFDPVGLRAGGLRPDDLNRDASAEPPPLLTRSHMGLDSPPNMDFFVDTQSMWQEMIAEDEDE